MSMYNGSPISRDLLQCYRWVIKGDNNSKYFLMGQMVHFNDLHKKCIFISLGYYI